MRLYFAALALAGSLAATSAVAAPVTLTFDGVGDLADIGNFYNGGADGVGNVGPAYGLTFSPLVAGLVDSDAGGHGNIANEPSGQTVLANFGTAPGVMNAANGFSGSVFFSYSTQVLFQVVAYSGLNQTGGVLGQVAITSFTPQSELTCSGDPTGQFCNWTQTQFSFNGVAHSLAFVTSGGAAEYVIDDLKLDLPLGAAVPEPGTWAMMIVGFGMAGGVLRRRQKLLAVQPA